MRTTIKMLEERIDRLEPISSQTIQQVGHLQRRINTLDRLLRGGEGREFESLLFRVTFLERLINPKKHIRPVTKKQMKEIRSLIREGQK